MEATLLNTTNLPEDVELYAYNAVVDAQCSDPLLAKVEASLEETIVGFPGLSVMRFDGKVVLAHFGQEIAEFVVQFLVSGYSGDGDAEDMTVFHFCPTMREAWNLRDTWEEQGLRVTIDEA